MKTWVCSPLSNIYAPTQGVARLYAYEKQQGHDITLKDHNQNAFFKLLSGEYLEEACDKLTSLITPISRNSVLKDNIGSILLNAVPNRNFERLLGKGIATKLSPYKFVSRINPLKKTLEKIVSHKINKKNVYYALIANKYVVIAQIDESRRILNDRFFDLGPSEFMARLADILCGKAIIDACCFPVQFELGFGFHGALYSPKTQDILRAITSERHNFLLPYYTKEVMPEFEKEQPELVGFSVTHTSELIPALTLAGMIKKKRPEVHICLGGATVTEVSHRLSKNPDLWNLFDSVVLGPGEQAFSDLIECVEKKSDLNTVPNLVFKRGSAILKSEKTQEFDLDKAVCPDFGKLRPGVPLPLETSSGCYWGKCLFCYYPKMGTSKLDKKQTTTRVRSIELVLDDMKKLQSRYNPPFIGLTDSAVSPARLEHIVENNTNTYKGKPIQFSAFMRFEKQFISKSFCRKLADGGLLGGQLGLESGSQRTNNIINKGIDVIDAEQILRNFYDVGIAAHIYSIVGVPGERNTDAIKTRDFIIRLKDKITLGWQIYPFYVLEKGPIAKQKDKYGLTLTALPDDFLVQAMEYEVQSYMTQKDSFGLSIKYTEELKKYLNKAIDLLDIETLKVFSLLQKSRGINFQISG